MIKSVVDVLTLGHVAVAEESAVGDGGDGADIRTLLDLLQQQIPYSNTRCLILLLRVVLRPKAIDLVREEHIRLRRIAFFGKAKTLFNCNLWSVFLPDRVCFEIWCD